MREENIYIYIYIYIYRERERERESINSFFPKEALALPTTDRKCYANATVTFLAGPGKNVISWNRGIGKFLRTSCIIL